MNVKTLTALIVLNVVVLGALVGVSFVEPRAEAQIGGNRAGDYIMVAANRSGRSWDTVYITDLNNGIMLAVEPNPQGRLDILTYRNITGDFPGAGGSR